MNAIGSWYASAGAKIALIAVAEKLKSHAETKGHSPGGWKTGDGSWAFMG